MKRLSILLVAVAWNNLVNAPSVGCPDGRPRVKPNADTSGDSYLMAKLLGVDLCGGGGLMPPGGSLAAADIQIVRAWIASGAPNN